MELCDKELKNLEKDLENNLEDKKEKKKRIIEEQLIERKKQRRSILMLERKKKGIIDLEEISVSLDDDKAEIFNNNFYCNFCNRTMHPRSANRHLGSKLHEDNLTKLKFERLKYENMNKQQNKKNQKINIESTLRCLDDIFYDSEVAERNLNNIYKKKEYLLNAKNN